MGKFHGLENKVGAGFLLRQGYGGQAACLDEGLI